MEIFTPSFYNDLIYLFQTRFVEKLDASQFALKFIELISDAITVKLDEEFHPYDHIESVYVKRVRELVITEIENTIQLVLCDKFYNDLFKIIQSHQRYDFLRHIRYASVVSMRSYPLGRYQRVKTPMILTSYDELEHLVESISRQKMRRKTIQYFGFVNFTFSVYEKLARLSIPIDDRFVLFLTLDHNPNNPDEFNPKKISKIFDFLTKVDRVHF